MNLWIGHFYFSARIPNGSLGVNVDLELDAVRVLYIDRPASAVLARAARCDAEDVEVVLKGAQLLDPVAKSECDMPQSRARLVLRARRRPQFEQGNVVIL